MPTVTLFCSHFLHFCELVFLLVCNLAGPWVFQGCWTDVHRTINEAGYASASMTIESCISFCTSKGFQYAGVEYSQECYCGSSLAAGSESASMTDCSMACSGNSTEACGGPNRLNLFYSSSPVGPQPNLGVNGFISLGCWAEGTNGRALSYGPAASIPLANLTAAKCMATCASLGYILAECGNSVAHGGVPATSGCSMPCNGNNTEICGGPSRLNLYSSQNPTSSFTPQLLTTAVPTMLSTSVSISTSTLPSTSTLATSIAGLSDFPAGWSAQGCWVDSLQSRSLPFQLPDSQNLTNAGCAQACVARGYIISGTEWYSQCFCGNAIYFGNSKTPDSDCNTPCSGNSKDMCGGADRLTIYSSGAPTVLNPPVVQTAGLNGSWAYQGCVDDNTQKRTLFWQSFFTGTLTANQCLNLCAQYGYAAAGLEYGQECYCGDPANIAAQGATFHPESECNVVCAGNGSAYCGGSNRLSTYFWTGPPLYNWTFAQGNDAGQYQLLINGVTVPLITMQSITGKVTFLSKFGTGPGNETGAYELDLSVTNNSALAWRPLHVQTDLFCAAGIILPDKAGRQLTIGGWSGQSTYGLRLYWPDGSPGVWGTHDWQENADELNLQRGRWYPGAMMMANGSVLVIGGEVGSDGAAVPYIEILPATGGGALYMDWLDRTDPWNLYPFASVLPGGGILVMYYNEARILDEKTFATLKTLPNAPGAVNNAAAGRTYPLEGTAVLMPQKYPYTDPIEVVICGGATPGVYNALDNCVSIAPEASNPVWTLERMPSPRVMPAIAPLPDGTFLVVNGAQHGRAGFGLSSNPNLNAMLYDPSKPHGSRFTVMANTTIARMYHNEAITLLDGRVLISGSDPLDGRNPEEYRVEVFLPPYLLTGKPRPEFSITNKDWSYGQIGISFRLTTPATNGPITVTLLGAVGSTHGNSMGARTLMPNFSCSGTSCTVDAPPNAHICPPGWYQMFVLDGGIPAIATFIRIGGDPARIGNWPNYSDFTVPGV
ncbi:glyoxal oxidase like protein [Thozetella sp. PMI_491]|nr:glyoxal oxidase like protein [Thozetella sp. PMI_491]